MKNNIVVIVAHPDDEVLGCGGTISRFVKEGNQVHILFMTDGVSSRNSSSLKQEITKRKIAAENANKLLGTTSVRYLNFPDNQMDSITRLEVIKEIEAFISLHKPLRVFTHHCGDVNIDHRVTHDAVIAACRPQPGLSVKELYFFEILSSTEWQTPDYGRTFSPNLFVDVSSSYHDKINALRVYGDELRSYPHSRSVEAVDSQLKLRGSSVGVARAEAFVVGRLLL